MRQKKPRRTPHQIEIMGLVLRWANNGTFIRQADLATELSYGPDVTRGAIRETVSSLERLGMLSRVRTTGNHANLVPTQRGYDWFRPAVPKP